MSDRPTAADRPSPGEPGHGARRDPGGRPRTGGGRGSASVPRRTTRGVGAGGEALAAAWYLGQGYRVLDRNYRTGDGEIDLIVSRRREVVFCEVKTRSDPRVEDPAGAVDAAKQARIRRLAARWLEDTGVVARSIRFDIVAVTPAGVEVVEGAF